MLKNKKCYLYKYDMEILKNLWYSKQKRSGEIKN